MILYASVIIDEFELLYVLHLASEIVMSPPKVSLVETLAIRGPSGFNAAIAAAARQQGQTVSEFARRAIFAKLPKADELSPRQASEN